MSKKVFGKVVCCLCSALLIASKVGAFGFFSSKPEEPKVEDVKAIYDQSVESIEKGRVEYNKLCEDVEFALAEIDGVKSEFKLCLEKSQDQLDKLNAAYDKWADVGFPIKGVEHDAYKAAKEEFDKVSADYALKKEAFEACCKRLIDLSSGDTKLLVDYAASLVNSVNQYYNYGIALAKSGVQRN